MLVSLPVQSFLKSNFLASNFPLQADKDIKAIIKSKTKTIRNIFANNNYKPNVLERDEKLIINYFREYGYLDVKVKTKIEYLKTNRVNIYLYIEEGDQYSFSSINIDDNKSILDINTLSKVNEKINLFLRSCKWKDM